MRIQNVLSEGGDLNQICPQQYCPDPLVNHEDTITAFNVGPPLAHLNGVSLVGQRWSAFSGIYIHSPTKKRCQSRTKRLQLFLKANTCQVDTSSMATQWLVAIIDMSLNVTGLPGAILKFLVRMCKGGGSLC